MAYPSTRGTGWKRDLPDPRDYWRRASPQTLKVLPDSIDLRQDMPPVVDQLQIGSCTANTHCNAVDYQRKKQGLIPLRGSRLFHYYNTRTLEGTVDSDSGASIRNTIKAGVEWGTAPEQCWPYQISRFREKPSQQCYDIAVEHQTLEYARVEQTMQEIMGCLAEGFVVQCGILIYRQFEQCGPSGVINMPNMSEQPLGGHSQLLCGYRRDSQGNVQVISQNSWGDTWGDRGYSYIPMGYLTNAQLTGDLWAIRLTEGEPPPPPPPPPPTPQPFNIGEKIARAMSENGDIPVSHEAYKIDENGVSMGWSEALAISKEADTEWRYTYVVSLDVVWRELISGFRG